MIFSYDHLLILILLTFATAIPITLLEDAITESLFSRLEDQAIEILHTKRSDWGHLFAGSSGSLEPIQGGASTYDDDEDDPLEGQHTTSPKRKSL